MSLEGEGLFGFNVQGLVVESFIQADDGAVELPIAVAEATHVIDERICETCWISVASNNDSGCGPLGGEADC